MKQRFIIVSFLIIASLILINNKGVFSQTDYSAQITACNVAGGTWNTTGNYCQYPPPRTCAPGESPSPTNPCVMSGGSGTYTPLYSEMTPERCAQQGGTWKPSTYVPSSYYCEFLITGAAGGCYCPPAPYCAPGTSPCPAAPPCSCPSPPYPSGCGGPGQPVCSGGIYPSGIEKCIIDEINRLGLGSGITVEQIRNNTTGLSYTVIEPLRNKCSGYAPTSGCGGPGQPACGPTYPYAPGYIPAGQVQHTWNFKDGKTQTSYILNRTDQEYQDFIARVHAQCLLVPFSGWKPNAGDSSLSNWQNFGIPECGGVTIETQITPTPQPPMCAQVITRAYNPEFCKEATFPNSCIPVYQRVGLGVNYLPDVRQLKNQFQFLCRQKNAI